MKNFHYKPRFLAPILREALSFSPVVVLTGARQVGKSTLLLHEEPFSAWKRYSLDDPETLSLLKRFPKDHLFTERLVIDEVQKAPEILSYIKLAVDEDRSRRFVLSGSANLLLMKQVAETLAGRAVYLELTPFLWDELREEPYGLPKILSGKLSPPSSPAVDLRQHLFKGFLPPLTEIESPEATNLWWKGYIATYLERDLRDLSQISNLADFHLFMEALSTRLASLLNQSDVARDVGLSAATASRYLNLLETSGFIVRLRPFFANLGKRLSKRPKLYFFDCGLARALAGYQALEEIPEEFWGRLFENFVFQQLHAAKDLLGTELFYFRTLGGKEIEVDFILKRGRKLYAFEVKFKERLSARDLEPLLAIKNLLPQIEACFLVYRGGEIEDLPGGVKAIPWWLL